MMHVNSLIAYNDEFEKLNKRAKLIYGHMAMEERPMTDREIKDALFGVMGDMNLARPRISDMIRDGWMVEVGKTNDSVTGKQVRLVKPISPEDRAERRVQAQLNF